MSLTLTAVEAAQHMIAVPMSGAWVPWPGSNPEPSFIGSLRTNLDGNQALKDIFKTIGVVIMIVWAAYILAKVALPGKGGGGARQIQWVGVILGGLVAGICLNLEALPNLLSVVLLAGSSILKWVGIG
jgi:hypothetical protein